MFYSAGCKIERKLNHQGPSSGMEATAEDQWNSDLSEPPSALPFIKSDTNPESGLLSTGYKPTGQSSALNSQSD